MELSKKDTKMMQGVSVLAMVCLHLFCRYDYEGLFTPIIFFRGFPLSFYLGQLSDFCVMGFAFCSGYAHMTQYMTTEYCYKRRLMGLLNLYINYWITLIIFSVISIFVGQREKMPGNILTFIENMIGIKTTYNGAAWYLFTYALIVTLSPIVLKILVKFNSVKVMLISLGMYLVAYYVRFESGNDVWLGQQLGKFGMTLFEYMIGAFCVKEKAFTKIYKKLKRLSERFTVLLSLFLFIVLLLGHTLIIGNVIIAPITGFVLLVLFKIWKKPIWVEKIFRLMGEHSTNIWLTHMYFYAVLFENLVYTMKYPFIIYIFMLLITLIVSYFINMIYHPIKEKLNCCFNK